MPCIVLYRAPSGKPSNSLSRRHSDRMVHRYFVAVPVSGVGSVGLASSMGSCGVAGSSAAAMSLIVLLALMLDGLIKSHSYPGTSV